MLHMTPKPEAMMRNNPFPPLAKPEPPRSRSLLPPALPLGEVIMLAGVVVLLVLAG